MMLIPRLANMMYDQAQEKLRRAEGNNKQVSRPRMTCLLELTGQRHRFHDRDEARDGKG